MTRQTQNYIYKKQKQVSIIAAILVLVLLISYVYFVNMTISTIADHNDFEDKIAAIQSGSTQVEEEYLSLQDGVNIEMAYNRGFVDTLDTKFVSREIRVSLYE